MADRLDFERLRGFCDGQTDGQTDRQTDGRTEKGGVKIVLFEFLPFQSRKRL